MPAITLKPPRLTVGPTTKRVVVIDGVRTLQRTVNEKLALSKRLKDRGELLSDGQPETHQGARRSVSRVLSGGQLAGLPAPSAHVCLKY
jgi:hypothetical protein